MRMIHPRPIPPRPPMTASIARCARGSCMGNRPRPALTLRGIGEEFEVSMTPAREAVRRLVGRRRADAVELGPGLDPGADQRPDRRTGRPARAARGGTGQPRPAARPHRADRTAAGDQRSIAEDIARHDAVAYIRSNLEFHRTLYLRAQAPAMLAMAETVWLQLGPTMRALYGRLRRTDPPHYHRLIIARSRPGTNRDCAWLCART